jgi:ABC-type antimicrobial peptide transport system permease subunit
MRAFPGLPPISGGYKPRFKRCPFFIKYALRNLMRRKGRETVVVLVIVISVATNSTLIAASESQQIILNETSKATNFDFFICLDRPSNTMLLEEYLEPFRENLVFCEFGYYTQAKVNGYTLFFIGAPMNASYFNYPLVSGRWFERDEDGVVLTENLARTLGVKVGDFLVVSNEIASINVTVVGIRRDLVFNVPIVPLNTAQKLDNSTGKVNAIVVKAKGGVDLDSLIGELSLSLPNFLWYVKKSGLVELGTRVLTDAFQTIAAIMIVFTWITSLLLIFSIAGQDINEERTNITILRALGMNRRSCILLVISKLLILGTFAAILCALFTPAFLIFFSTFLSQTMTVSIPLTFSPDVLMRPILFILATIFPSGLALGIYIMHGGRGKAIRLAEL